MRMEFKTKINIRFLIPLDKSEKPFCQNMKAFKVIFYFILFLLKGFKKNED